MKKMDNIKRQLKDYCEVMLTIISYIIRKPKCPCDNCLVKAKFPRCGHCEKYSQYFDFHNELLPPEFPFYVRWFLGLYIGIIFNKFCIIEVFKSKSKMNDIFSP